MTKPLTIALVLLASLTMATSAQAAGGVVTSQDARCYHATGFEIGVVLAGSTVYVTGREEDGRTEIYSPRHGKMCWLDNAAFEKPGDVHLDDIRRTLRWRVLVQRWLPDFPDLTEDLVLAVILKEGKGYANPVDATGNDIRLLGQASVGPMQAIPRPHLPCYEKLTGENAINESGCAIYLGMYILNSAIQSAHEYRVGGLLFLPTMAGTLHRDSACTTTPGGADAIGWILAGTYVGSVKTIQNGAGVVTHAKVYDERHAHLCWISTADVDLDTAPEIEAHYAAITEDDIRLGLALFNCSAESLFADNCEAWGGYAYADEVLGRVLPAIQEALK